MSMLGLRAAEELRALGLPRGLRAFGREAAIAVVTALIYFLIRGGVVDRVGEATDRAGGLMDLERSLGLFWEPAMQGWILSSRALIDLANAVYFWTHMPVIIVVAVALYWRRPSVYRLIRNAFVVSAAIALLMYFLLPLAPPRFFPELGFVDTMALYSSANYQAQEVGLFVNPFAALPSLHFGWALLIGIALWLGRPSGRRGAALALVAASALVAGQFLAVIVTGNHYLLDVVAGLAVAGAGMTVSLMLRRVASRRGPTSRSSSNGGVEC